MGTLNKNKLPNVDRRMLAYSGFESTLTSHLYLFFPDLIFHMGTLLKKLDLEIVSRHQEIFEHDTCFRLHAFNTKNKDDMEYYFNFEFTETEVILTIKLYKNMDLIIDTFASRFL